MVYREKFLKKLRETFLDFCIQQEGKDIFFSFSGDKQTDFLLHPDIATLILHAPVSSKNQLGQELIYIVKNPSHYTPNLGVNIPGTNIKLTCEDNNPVVSNRKGWGDREESEWLLVFGKAFKLLKNIDIQTYKELNSIIKKIIPIGTSIDVHNSYSYKNCIGTLYLGYTIDTDNPEFNILEALIHESSHNKLNLIMQSEKLLLNDLSLQYYSPYRPDARHMQGVLLGVHAIVPTVYIMIQAVDKGFITDESWISKILLSHIKNKLGYNVLRKYGIFTQIGSQIFHDIGQVILLTNEIVENNNLFKNIDLSDINTRAKNHLIQVINANSKLKY